MSVLLRPSFFAVFAVLTGSMSIGSQFAEGQTVEIQGIRIGSVDEGDDAQASTGAAIAIDGLSGGVSSFSIGGPAGFLPLGGGLVGGVDPDNRSQLFDLLSNQSVRRELKLTEQQIEGVQLIMRESGKRMQTQIRAAMEDMKEGDGNLKLDFGQLMKEKQTEAENAIEEILLPEQLKRVRQLAYQIEVASEGLGESLVNGRLGKDIGVYDDQKQHLTDRARVIEEELRLAIVKVQMAARAKLFAELTPDQRKEAEALLGTYFQYEQPNVGALLREKLKEKDNDGKPATKR